LWQQLLAQQLRQSGFGARSARGVWCARDARGPRSAHGDAAVARSHFGLKLRMRVCRAALLRHGDFVLLRGLTLVATKAELEDMLVVSI
jgi:hypothetical protein